MPGKIHLALAGALLTGVGVIGATTVAEAGPWSRGRSIALHDAAGTRVGTVVVQRRGVTKVRVGVQVRGLAPGFHGFHIHTTGVCDPKAVDPATGQVTPFFTAGGHLDVARAAAEPDTTILPLPLAPKNHGDHAGDLPPLLAGEDGVAAASFITDRFRVGRLTDADGAAFVVHALPDNLAHIPERYGAADAATLRTGDAGGRVACGVLR
ncbi:superoxide dismutase [Herbidospora sp. NEAU-GS84]|uniref:Superoxide dismutase n=1 Tax=Herbidospora solisilvae TaxID=2696284 RepID=A0A7C9P1H8_9ACTN|nr:superoxide dismutase family protein [Herbidospora solisilvae]NAS24737.1 superoxide dismutase [Herbidospora solisilvae]